MNIILIDDNISTTSLLRDSIDWKALNIDRVFIANSAQEAKKLISENNIEIIICDIEMPQQDGLSLIRELRANQCNAVCIFLTAHAEFRFAQAAIELNSSDYILKPFTIDDITQKIAQAVEQAELLYRNNTYIRFGKAWIDSQQKLTGLEKDDFIASGDSSGDILIQKAKQYIQDNYVNDISLQDIADHVHLNPNYLIKAFKKSEKITPIDYLNHVRIAQAKLLLLSNKFSVGQVSMMTGFNNIPYFTKVFKKHTGKTPSEYKSSHS